MMVTVEPAYAVLDWIVLREQIREGTFERVMLTAPDRLARNYVHQMLLIEEFRARGVSGAVRGSAHEP